MAEQYRKCSDANYPLTVALAECKEALSTAQWYWGWYSDHLDECNHECNPQCTQYNSSSTDVSGAESNQDSSE